MEASLNTKDLGGNPGAILHVQKGSISGSRLYSLPSAAGHVQGGIASLLSPVTRGIFEGQSDDGCARERS